MGRPSTTDILATCEAHWRSTNVPEDLIPELRSRLIESMQSGRGPRPNSRDPVRIAEALASRHRVPPPPTPFESPAARANRRWFDLVPAYGWLVPIVVITVALMLFGPKEATMEDTELWRWLWLGIAVVLGIGEMVTSGFFMLPFAIGAGVAALLAWADVSLPVQLVVFIITSVVALLALRRFAWSDREPSYPVGAKRFVNASAVVTETIDPVSGQGRVRLDAETWWATTDTGAIIEPGTPVRVVEVRGTRLVVEPRP
ncbi:MAG: NfeD family protein [Acidimicrobiia bacterium]